MERSDTIATLSAALLKVQAALEPVKREAENPHLGKRYADLNSILDECRPLLTEQGISVIHLPGRTKPLGATIRHISKDGEIDEYPLGEVELTIMLLHRDGEYLAETMSLPCLMEYPQPAQGAVGALSYGRRHSILAALLMETEGDGGGGSDIPLADADKCPVHNLPWRHVSGVYREGHEKAGQTYAFWSCPGKVDGKYCQQRPPQGYKGPGASSDSEEGEAEAGGTGTDKVSLHNAFETERKRIGGSRLINLQAWLAGTEIEREIKSPNDLNAEELAACIAWLKEQEGGAA